MNLPSQKVRVYYKKDYNRLPYDTTRGNLQLHEQMHAGNISRVVLLDEFGAEIVNKPQSQFYSTEEITESEVIESTPIKGEKDIYQSIEEKDIYQSIEEKIIKEEKKEENKIPKDWSSTRKEFKPSR